MPMSSSISGMTPSDGGARPVHSSADREIWLRVMEREGLRDALAGIRRFPLGEQSPNDHEPAPNAQTAIQTSHVTAASLRPGEKNTGKAVMGSASEKPAAALAGIPPSLALKESSASVPPSVGIFRQAEAGYRAAQSTKTDTTPVPATPIRHSEWLRTNVAVLHGVQGAEIWVRDASMDPMSERGVLARMRDLLGSLGTRLKSFSVNGKTVFVASVTSDESRNFSEK